VISLGGFHPYLPETTDCVIEDCIANQPGLNNTHETSVLSIIGGAAAVPEEKPSYGRGCVIRRNLVDCTYSRNEVPIQSITLAGAVATVTTVRAHGRETGNYVVIAGAVVNGTELNGFNGSYSISKIDDATFEYAPSPLPVANPVGAMFVDRFSSHWVPAGANSIIKESPDPDSFQYRLTTLTPHNRIPGNNVVINGVYGANTVYQNAFNASHPVDLVLSRTVLLFTIHPTPEKPVDTIDWSRSAVYIGVQFHLAGGGGTCHLLEHNCVIGATVGVYADTWSTRTLHVRNNQFHRVRYGVNRNMQGYNSPAGPITGSCLAYSEASGKYIATFTSIQPHGLTVGGSVTIGGALVAYGNEPPLPYTNVYNGTFTVLDVPSPNKFRYELLSKPPAFGTTPEYPTNAGGSPVFSPGGTLIAIVASSIIRAPTSDNPTRVKFTTPIGQTHNFQVGNSISVFGAKMISGASATYFNPYNGVFEVFEIDSLDPTHVFYYRTLTTATADTLSDPATMCANQSGTALTREGTTATFRTVRPHFLEVGQIASIVGARVEGDVSNLFNGPNLAITSVGLTTFNYQMATVPATHANGPAGYRGKDIEGLLQIENNLFEMVTNLQTTDDHLLNAVAVSTWGGNDFRPNYIFRQVAIRGNLIRHEDSALDFKDFTNGFFPINVGTLLLENNLFALNRTWPIVFDQSGMVSCVNNRRPEGTLVQAYDRATAHAADLYFPAAEDAMGLAMI